MGEKLRGQLTESMFYVLMAFLDAERCGIDVAEFVRQRTKGRLHMGPGTIYTLLAKFQSEGLIEETEVDEGGRKRTYALTEKGRSTFMEELDRLRSCVADGEEELQCGRSHQ